MTPKFNNIILRVKDNRNILGPLLGSCKVLHVFCSYWLLKIRSENGQKYTNFSLMNISLTVLIRICLNFFGYNKIGEENAGKSLMLKKVLCSQVWIVMEINQTAKRAMVYRLLRITEWILIKLRQEEKKYTCMTQTGNGSKNKCTKLFNHLM